jgi:hypothetical protein
MKINGLPVPVPHTMRFDTCKIDIPILNKESIIMVNALCVSLENSGRVIKLTDANFNGVIMDGNYTLNTCGSSNTLLVDPRNNANMLYDINQVLTEDAHFFISMSRIVEGYEPLKLVCWEHYPLHDKSFINYLSLQL